MACRTATPADGRCFASVQRLQLAALAGAPLRLANLTPAATFEQLQRELARAGESECPEPCERPLWEDPLRNSVNKEPPRASFVPFESAERASEQVHEHWSTVTSQRVQLLTGPPAELSWSFHFSPRIYERPSVLWESSDTFASRARLINSSTPGIPFYDDNFDDSPWTRVPVPSNWEVRCCLHARASSHSRCVQCPWSFHGNVHECIHLDAWLRHSDLRELRLSLRVSMPSRLRVHSLHSRDI